MRKKIGELQEEYLQFSHKISSVLERIHVFFAEKDWDSCFKYSKVIVEYGKLLPDILLAFGYDQEVETVKLLVRLFECCETEDDILAEKEAYEIAVNGLLDIVVRLLDEHSGQSKICNCCKEKIYYKRTEGKEAVCPFCMSKERDRLTTAFLKKLELDNLVHAESLLHTGISPAIDHWIYANCPAMLYTSLDLSDMQKIASIEDESYDYFTCFKELGCLGNDKKLMKELYRILKADGIGLFFSAVSLEEKWEDDGIGFSVHPLGKDFFGGEVFAECGVSDAAILYALTKQEGDIEGIISERKKKRNREWEQPLVSVILPSYNHEKYVAEAIESVLDQSYQNYEFLVADDGSTDRTVEEIMKYEDRIDQIHIVESNMGGKTAVMLMEKTKGKYIAMMHSDDKWAPDKLEKQVIYLENHPDCAACFTGCKRFTDDGDFEEGMFMMQNMKKEEWLHYFYKNDNCLAHPSVMIYRDAYLELFGRYGNSLFRQLPDFWMWLSLVQKAEIHVIERELTLFRIHESGGNQNASARTHENNVRHWIERNYIWFDLIRKMDNAYFLEAFKDELRKKDAKEEQEVMCEKLFVLLNAKGGSCMWAAIFYLYEIYKIDGIPELLEDQYQFTNKDIYRIVGEYGTESGR